jgi:hypothetical protein
VRAAIAAALRYINDRAEYEPVADPRDTPHRLRPVDRQTLEGQLRLRATLGDLRRRADAWHHDPASLDSAGLAVLVADLSTACSGADEFRQLISEIPNERK